MGKGIGITVEFFRELSRHPGLARVTRLPVSLFFYRNRGRIAALVETFSLLLRFLSVFSLFLSCSFLSDSLSTGEILQKN